jgi:hypothetical protein
MDSLPWNDLHPRDSYGPAVLPDYRTTRNRPDRHLVPDRDFLPREDWTAVRPAYWLCDGYGLQDGYDVVAGIDEKSVWPHEFGSPSWSRDGRRVTR